jgi:hypothetical protein
MTPALRGRVNNPRGDPMSATRPLDAAVKAEVTADLNGLPHGRITQYHDVAHVFTVGLAELELWFMALGGPITRQPDGQGVVHYTLRTFTERTHGARIAVHASALVTDQIDPGCADAVINLPAA